MIRFLGVVAVIGCIVILIKFGHTGLPAVGAVILGFPGIIATIFGGHILYKHDHRHIDG